MHIPCFRSCATTANSTLEKTLGEVVNPKEGSHTGSEGGPLQTLRTSGNVRRVEHGSTHPTNLSRGASLQVETPSG